MEGSNMLVERTLTAAQEATQLRPNTSFELGPERTGLASEIGFDDEQRVVIGAWKGAERHEVEHGHRWVSGLTSSGTDNVVWRTFDPS
jgi:hypothetical protein